MPRPKVDAARISANYVSHKHRVSVVVKLDIRPGHEGALESKLESVERHLS